MQLLRTAGYEPIHRVGLSPFVVTRFIGLAVLSISAVGIQAVELERNKGNNAIRDTEKTTSGFGQRSYLDQFA